MKRVLVTGGAGFIGSHLVEALIKRGDEVVVIDNLSTGRLENLRAVKDQIEIVTSPVQLARELHWIVSSVDVIVHLAATVGVARVMKAPAFTLRNNAEATVALLDAAVTYRKPLVFASTSEVYGLSKKLPYCEEDPTSFGQALRWSYAVSKLHDEFHLRATAHTSGLVVRIARLFNTVGPRQRGDYGMVLPRFVEAALHNRPLRVYDTGEQTRTFVHVDDTVRALIGLADLEHGRRDLTVNVGGDEEISIRALAERVIARTGSKSAIEHVTNFEVYGVGFEDMVRRAPNISRAEHVLDFRVTKTLDEIIDDTVRYASTDRATLRPRPVA